MSLNPDRLYRAASGFLAGDAENKSLILRGVPIVFDAPTVIFETDGIKYYEQIARGAFDRADLSDIIFNYNHHGRVYARTRNGTLDYDIGNNAFNITARLMPDDTGHQQLYRDIRSGLIDKMSFSFTVEEENYNSETRTRTILKIKKLYDVSAVDIPAYNETSISARNFFKEENEKEIRNSEQARLRKLLVVKTLL
ncbi:MAG: HK97 family phage prohead protease [Oscillospiraceae bacterium]|nr:HK97 family phage prohead protease [Oscillospiraceae bacterium]